MRRAVLVVAVSILGCGGGHGTVPDADPGNTSTIDASMCGDNGLDTGEQCDDGNSTSGDGCSATCKIEPGWICITPGAPCLRQVYCGDGVVEPPEVCDDGNSVPGD